MEIKSRPLAGLAAAIAAAGAVTWCSVGNSHADAKGGGADMRPLKDAKLIIEHNATDQDTGFQGFIDGDGWRRLSIAGPAGAVLTIETRGTLGGSDYRNRFSKPSSRKTPEYRSQKYWSCCRKAITPSRGQP